MKEKVIVIVGPTGIGKTELALKLCEKYNGEVINSDASQMKRKLNIGTAKIDLSKTDVVHHLIDIINPDETYSCADFQKSCRELITKINKRGKVPFIVGGTGLYASCAIYDYKLDNSSRDESFVEEYKDYTNDELFDILEKLDFEQSKKLHKNNRIRVIRAIECARKGIKISEKTGKLEPVYDALVICLTCDRNYLYERINKRVLNMIEEGLIDEVKGLIDQGYNPFSIPDLGYCQIDEYLENAVTLDEAIDNIQKETRHYAKRQISWFNNQMKCINVDIDKDFMNAENIIDKMITKYLQK